VILVLELFSIAWQHWTVKHSWLRDWDNMGMQEVVAFTNIISRLNVLDQLANTLHFPCHPTCPVMYKVTSPYL
jgi:hypothetical protein